MSLIMDEGGEVSTMVSHDDLMAIQRVALWLRRPHVWVVSYDLWSPEGGTEDDHGFDLYFDYDRALERFNELYNEAKTDPYMEHWKGEIYTCPDLPSFCDKNRYVDFEGDNTTYNVALYYMAVETQNPYRENE